MTIRLGTRGSRLALWQARTVAALLQERAGTACEIVTIRTRGDEVPGDTSAEAGTAEAGGAVENVKRLFVKEIEEALLDGRIDMAVHSAKDLSAAQPEGLIVAAALTREDPRDALVLPAASGIAGDLNLVAHALGERPRIGTSSVRRTAELARWLPRASFVGIRGNVDTRLRKLDAGACDAVALAVAGLRRLGFDSRISLALPVDISMPAPGQGIVAVQTRADRHDLATALAAVNDADAADALAAEQALVAMLGGGCHLPIGALARLEGAELVISGIVLTPDGARVVREERRGPRGDAAAVGAALGQALLDAGAGALLRTAPA